MEESKKNKYVAKRAALVARLEVLAADAKRITEKTEQTRKTIEEVDKLLKEDADRLLLENKKSK